MSEAYTREGGGNGEVGRGTLENIRAVSLLSLSYCLISGSGTTVVIQS